MPTKEDRLGLRWFLPPACTGSQGYGSHTCVTSIIVGGPPIEASQLSWANHRAPDEEEDYLVNGGKARLQAVVAVMRKLLHALFALFCSNQIYNSAPLAWRRVRDSRKRVCAQLSW